MSCFNLYSNNLVDKSILTSTNENAQFPASNVKDTRRTKVFRSTTNTDSMIFDFGEASDIDTVFILADKRNGFGFDSALVQFNGTSNFTSPAYSYSITLSEAHNLAHLEITKISYRFCRIIMTSTLGYTELSKVYVGSKLSLSKGIKFGWTQKDNDLSSKSKNRYGQLFVDTIIRQKVIGFSFSYLSKDDLATINSVVDYSSEIKPLWVMIGDASMSDDYRRTTGSFILSDVPSIANTHFNKYQLSFNVEELT